MAALVACGSEPAGDATKVTYLTSFSTFGRDAYAYVSPREGWGSVRVVALEASHSPFLSMPGEVADVIARLG